MKKFDTIKETRKIKDSLYKLYKESPIAYKKEMEKASKRFREEYIYTRKREAA